MLSEAPSYTISFYYRRILVPIDGSETSFKALQIAIDLAHRYGSRVVVVYARPKNSSEDPIAKAKERLKNVPVSITYKYIEYDPSSESAHSALLREIIEGGYDLVVMGARGKTLMGDLNIGSIALAITINTPTSILIVR